MTFKTMTLKTALINLSMGASKMKNIKDIINTNIDEHDLALIDGAFFRASFLKSVLMETVNDADLDISKGKSILITWSNGKVVAHPVLGATMDNTTGYVKYPLPNARGEQIFKHVALKEFAL